MRDWIRRLSLCVVALAVGYGGLRAAGHLSLQLLEITSSRR